MIGLITGGLAIISLSCTYLSEKEKEKQDQLIQELDNYRANLEKQIDKFANAAEKEIDEYRKAILKKKRALSKPIYEKLCSIIAERIRDKEDSLKLCNDAFSEVESVYKKQSKSYARAHTMRKSLYSIKETCYRVEAYIEYLRTYKELLDFKFMNEGEIPTELFSFTLPEDFPYEGKILMLSKDDFKKKGKNGVYYEFMSGYSHSPLLALNQFEIPYFEKLSDKDFYPFMVSSYMTKKEEKRLVLSLSKGIVQNSIGKTDGFVAEITKEYADNYLLSVCGLNIATINKSDIKNELRKDLKKGSELRVFAKQYNYALTEYVKTTQSPNTSISIDYFETIPLVVTEGEFEEICDFICNNNFDQNSDLWKISPADEDQLLRNIKMQSANDYILYATFEVYNEKLILKYKGLTADHKQFIDYGDAYVTTKATLEPTYLSEIDEINDTSETELLHLYLENEFAEQRKLLINSPISLYVSQWSSVMERLYDKKTLGSSHVLDISEVKILSNKDVILAINPNTLKSVNRFVAKEKKKKKEINDNSPFFVFVFDTKCSINWESSENNIIYDRIEFKLPIGYSEDNIHKLLISTEFKLNVYAGDVAYAEKKQFEAINNYRLNNIVDEEIKRKFNNPEKCIFKDNGQRVETLDNEKLLTNPSQLYAVKRALAEDKFFLIQGPPGTGKTTVIKELIHQQLNKDKDSRILIVSQSNVAVDNVLKGLDPNRFKFIRCATLGKIVDDKIKDYTFDNQCELYNYSLSETAPNKRIEELRDQWRRFIQKQPKEALVDIILSGYQIIGATCVGLENRTFGLSNSEFDLVIIDEAGKALVGELLIPINRAKKVVMIGDHKQLPPVIDPLLYSNNSINDNVDIDDIVDEEDKEDLLNKSIFYRLFESMPDDSKVMLNTQFRMPKVIGDFVNMFYDGQLLTGTNCLSKKPLMLDSHLIFIDMCNVSNYIESEGNGSPRNLKEIEVVLLIVKKIREQEIIDNNKRIVVITPYKGQKHELNKAISYRRCKNVVVDTVDAFQGDEEDIVIFCSTRAKTPTNYFSTPERLNVAFSRTKNTLIYIGSSKYFSRFMKENSVMQRVGKYLDENAKIISYNELTSKDFSVRNINTYKNLHIDQPKTYPLSYGDEFFHKKTYSEVVAEDIIDIEKASQLRQNRIKKTKDIIQYQRLSERGVPCIQCSTLYLEKENSPSKLKLCDICANEQVPFFVCKDCNITQYRSRKFTIESSYKPVRCNNCKEKRLLELEVVEIKQCVDCNEEIRITRKTKDFYHQKGWDLPTRCETCREKHKKKIEEIKREQERKNKIAMHATCSECGSKFTITQGEVEFYNEKDFALPKKCKNCRRKN